MVRNVEFPCIDLLETRRMHTRQDSIRSETFWKHILKDYSPSSALSRYVPSIHREYIEQPSEYSRTLSKTLTTSLYALTSRHGLTLHTLLQGVWGILLSRYTREDDVMFGVTLSPYLAQMVVSAPIPVVQDKILPMRIQIQSKSQLIPWLKGLQRRYQQICQYADSVLEQVEQWYDTIPQVPLCESLLIFKNHAGNPIEQIPSTQNEPQLITAMPRHGISDIPIIVTATLTQENELHLTISRRAEYLNNSILARLLEHMLTLLQEIVSNPKQMITALPLLTEHESQCLLVEWNATHHPYPDSHCIHQLIEEQVQRTPDAIAAIFGEVHLTYQALNWYATKLAAQLRRLGIGPDKLVGICVERSLEMVIGLLGILKSGGAYVPLDPGYPWERLNFMLKDTDTQVLLTQRNIVEKLPLQDMNIVYIDQQDLVGGEGAGESIQEVQMHPENLAYLIYTSGSTGIPKGVQIPHRAIVNFLSSMCLKLSITNRDILFSVTTFSFDIAYLELFLPLVIGAKLVLASRVAANGFRLGPALAEAEATVMQATPATWTVLTRTKWHNTTLQKIFCGGETLTSDLARNLREQAASLWNLYGPTETTIWSTATEITSETISIGRPIGNTSVYLLDTYLMPVPIGITGELYIGGKGLARGYRNRPDLTAEHFIPHPFSIEPGERLYRTGDLARYNDDGTLEHRGRIDNQVKVRGFRIELGEIEAVLSQHHAVNQCVVVIHEEIFTDKLLVAYVVSKKQKLPIEELRHFLRQHVPSYMIPTTFVLLDALPLTPNGKINRRALPTSGISS